MTTTAFTALDLLVAPKRTIDGIRWYSAKEVLAAFKLSDSALAAVPARDTTSGKPAEALIEEPAFFRLALMSKAEEAQALRKWLCLVILPAIFVSNSYLLHEELAMKAKVEGVLDLPEWAVERSTRHILPLLRKNGFYFGGMEDVALGLETAEDFEVARDAAMSKKKAELQALGFSA